MRLWIRAEVLRLTNIRASQNRSQGTPGPEGSIGKLAMAEVNKDISEFAVDLLGAAGMLFSDGYPMARPDDGRACGPTRSRRSCGRGPTRSRAARPRS